MKKRKLICAGIILLLLIPVLCTTTNATVVKDEPQKLLKQRLSYINEHLDDMPLRTQLALLLIVFTVSFQVVLVLYAFGFFG